MKKKLHPLFLAFLLISSCGAFAQETYTPSMENLEARKAFQDDKFGMFIHWGIYSILGDGEWVMTNQNIKIDRYELLPSFFNPIDFDARNVVQLAKEAGMKYITITTKHHDGFAMYHSKVSKYNIVDNTPFKRDIFRELEQECKKQGIKLYAYYSQLDWNHTDYFPRGHTGQGVGRPDSGDWENYLAYQNAQIKELAENYNISGFWFDGFWDILKEKGRTPETRKAGKDRWKLIDTYRMLHGINSALLIGNNHHLDPFPGEDFQMFEKDLPGKNTTNFGSAKISQLPLETCETINHSWGFNLQDGNHKSVKQLIHYLVNAAGRNGNFLLNVGPMPNGDIQKEHKERLKMVGVWLKDNGKSIYGTRAGIVAATDDYVSTQKGKTLYLHLLNPELKEISIADFREVRVKSVKLLNGTAKLGYKLRRGTFRLNIPDGIIDDIDTVFEITLR